MKIMIRPINTNEKCQPIGFIKSQGHDCLVFFNINTQKEGIEFLTTIYADWIFDDKDNVLHSIAEEELRRQVEEYQKENPGLSVGLTNSKDLVYLENNHINPILTNTGSSNYGNWEIMEIIEKYGKTLGQKLALKHLLRKPKTNLHEDAYIDDLKKAVTYIQRDIDELEGRYKRGIV